MATHLPLFSFFFPAARTFSFHRREIILSFPLPALPPISFLAETFIPWSAPRRPGQDPAKAFPCLHPQALSKVWDPGSDILRRQALLWFYPTHNRAFLVAQMVKNLLAMLETLVQSLSWEDPLEEGMAAHSSIFAWRIPRTEEPGYKSMGLQRVEHN